MKLPQLNLTRAKIQEYVHKVGTVNKFLKYWGTEYIDGIEVMKSKKYIYPNMDSDTVQLLKFLGAYNNVVNQDWSGVDNAWLYLNYAKGDNVTLEKELIHTVLNEVPRPGKSTEVWGRVTIGPTETNTRDILGGTMTSYSDLGIQSSINDQAGLKAEIVSKIETLWTNAIITSDSKKDPVKDVMLRYILRSKDVRYTLGKVTVTYETKNVVTAHYSLSKSSGTVYTYSTLILPAYTIEIMINPTLLVAMTTTHTDDMIDMIYADLFGGTRIGSVVIGPVNLNRDMTTASIEKLRSATSTADYSYTSAIQSNVGNSADVWYLKQTGSTIPSKGSVSQPIYSSWLKASVLRGNSITLDQKIKLIGSAIDSGYVEQGVEWWKMVIVMILVVAVARFAAPYAPQAAAAMFTWLGVSLVTAEVIITASFVVIMVALAVQVLGMLEQTWGDYTGARATGQFSHTIQPLTMVASIVLMINSIGALYELGKDAIWNEGAKGFMDKAPSGLDADTITLQAGNAGDIAVNNASWYDKFWAGLKSTVLKMGLSGYVAVLGQVASVLEKLDMDKQRKKISDAQNQLDASNAAVDDMLNKANMGREMITLQAHPLDAISSQTEIDYMYEPVFRNLHIGNICRRTFTAMNTDRKIFKGYDARVSENELKDNRYTYDADKKFEVNSPIDSDIWGKNSWLSKTDKMVGGTGWNNPFLTGVKNTDMS